MMSTLLDVVRPDGLLRKDGVVRRSETDAGRMEAYLPSPCVQNHAANIMPLPGGEVACVWFGGRQEGILYITVWFSRLRGGAWSVPVKLSDDPGRSEQNPIL